MRHEGDSNGNCKNEHSRARNFQGLEFVADFTRQRATDGRENGIQRKAEAETHRRKTVDFLVNERRRGDIPEQDNHWECAYQEIRYVGAVLETFTYKLKLAKTDFCCGVLPGAIPGISLT